LKSRETLKLSLVSVNLVRKELGEEILQKRAIAAEKLSALKVRLMEVEAELAERQQKVGSSGFSV